MNLKYFHWLNYQVNFGYKPEESCLSSSKFILLRLNSEPSAEVILRNIFIGYITNELISYIENKFKHLCTSEISNIKQALNVTQSGKLRIWFITEKNKLYSYILIPYILWLLFASYLSYNIYIKSFEIMKDEINKEITNEVEPEFLPNPNDPIVAKAKLLENPDITEEERNEILSDPDVKAYHQRTPAYTQEEIDDAVAKLKSLENPNLDEYIRLKIMNDEELYSKANGHI